MMDPQDPRFKARVIVKTMLLSEILPMVVNPGRTTATALRILAKIAETDPKEITEEMVTQEIDFLLADIEMRTK